MTFWDYLRSIFAPYKESFDSAQGKPALVAARAPMPPSTRLPTAGRVSKDDSGMLFGDTWVMVPPQDYESLWRTLNLDAAHLDTYSPKELLDMLADLSPEVSRALWDFQRLCNPGWECKAFVLGSEDTEDAQAQQALDAFLDTLRDTYGSVDIVIGRLFTGPFVRGAFCAELVLDRGRMPVDIATPDPYSVRFRKRNDPIRGEVWQPGQWQGNFVPLDIPTFKYLPIDPMPGIPYGRPLAAPALFTSIFLLSLLHDVKRVVMQQGYKRMDISISLEQAIAAYSQDTQGLESLGAFIAQAVADVSSAYAALEPDDAFIHSDMVILNDPAGTVDSDSIGAIDKIIEKLERMATRALKSNSLLMGNDESASETDSNRRWEIHAAGIKSIQHYCEAMLESLLTLALQAQGMQARVEFRFSELRAAEMLRDAQTDAMKVQNARAKYEAGYYSQDEASNEAVGHDADAPEPRGGVGAPMPEPLQDDGDGNERNDGGSDRKTAPPSKRVSITPDGADEPLLPIPDEVTISDGDTDRALADWDDLMPDYAGLLDATVTGIVDSGDERIELSVNTRATGTTSPWVYDNASHRYRNTTTGRYVGQKQMTELRDQFVEAKRGAAQALAADLASGNKSVQEFEVAFRREIKTVFVDQYVLAKGGRNAMTQSDWGTVGHMVREQYAYAHDFALDIASGKLSQAQIAQRAGLYFDSSTRAFEQGRSASYGTPTLPEYPADGTQKCRSRCKCRWDIKETDDAWECSWRLNPSAEHCADCLSNSEKWSPLILLKAGRGREDIERILEGMTNGFH